MTVFCNIHHYCLLPAEQEVAEAGARRHCDAQVPVVRHEHQHEEVTDHHLDHVKKRLEEVRETQHSLADCFMRFHEHGAISSWDRHGVVTHVHLIPSQQELTADLQTLVEHSQQEHTNARAYHFSWCVDDQPSE